MIVMKFGGSSVESAAAIERVAGIVARAVPRAPVVVVSAMGKATEQLLTMGAEAAGGEKEQALARLRGLRETHEREIGALLPPAARESLRLIDSHFHEMADLLEQLADRREFSPAASDALASHGERLSSQLIALVFSHRGINAQHADARCVVVTDGRHKTAAPLYPQTYARIRDKISPLVEAK